LAFNRLKRVISQETELFIKATDRASNCTSLRKHPHFALMWIVTPSLQSCYSRDSEELRTAEPGFDSRQRQDIFLYSPVQTESGAHPTFYPVGTGVCSPGDKAAEA
jgi:hypothetical protein